MLETINSWKYCEIKHNGIEIFVQNIYYSTNIKRIL